MKIVQVEIFDIHMEGAPAWHPVILRATTDEGITGLGEVGLAYGTGHSAGVGMARNLAEQFMLGADPFQSELLWDTMFRASFWGRGGGPVVYGGMSAIDTALWDIKGKALGVPVYQLLGGKTNDRLRTYASQIQFGWGTETEKLVKPEEYAEAALKAVAEGYDCVKVDPIMYGPEGETDTRMLRGLLSPAQLRCYRDRVGAIREAVGPDVDIIIEAHSHLTTGNAIQLGRLWEPYECILYEEPVHYVNSGLHEMVAHSVSIPTAAGERIYTRWGYRPYFEQQSLSLIQPDLGLVGGISEGKKICDYAHVYDVLVQVHVCGSPVATAAALHLETAIPNFGIHEHHTRALKPDNIALCTVDLQPERGIFVVPEEPGLGVMLNDEVVSQSPCLVLKV